MKAVIMAGGKGTRISSIASNIPKPMLRIGGKPVLEHEIECLRDQGIRDIIMTVGHLGKNIMEYFGDGSRFSRATGKTFGVNIEYYYEKEPMGNAGALFQLKDSLQEDFLLLNGDVVFDVDFERFVNYHRRKKGIVTLFTHPNSHPYDSGLILTDAGGSVRYWLTKEESRPLYYKNRVNAGLHIISPAILNKEMGEQKVDLDRQLLKPLAGSGEMFAYDSPEYVRDMGTPERYREIASDYITGKIQARNLRNKQRAVFLDRDGTLNRYVGFLRNKAQMELLSGVAEAVRLINQSEYLAIMVTNQPVIARGEISYEQLQLIHDKLETLLAQKGAYLDAIYFCPHHPDRGYPGERQELKVDCDCRKPKPGMLLQAANDFNIDLTASWMVGDSESDIKAGMAAGCHTALLSHSYLEWGQTITVSSLMEFVDKYIGIHANMGCERCGF